MDEQKKQEEPLQKDKRRRFCFPVSPPTSWQSSALRGPSLGPGPSSSGGQWMQPRHVPRLQAAASETASLLSSREHQATDTRGATKQEEKRRGSVQPARPQGLEEHGLLRLLPQGRGSTGWGHSIISPDRRAGERHVTEQVSEAPESLTGLGAKSHHISKRRQLLLPAHRQQSRATRNTENREP